MRGRRGRRAARGPDRLRPAGPPRWRRTERVRPAGDGASPRDWTTATGSTLGSTELKTSNRMTRLKSVYERLSGVLPVAAIACALVATALPRRLSRRASTATVVDAREAYRKKDRGRLAMARATGCRRAQSARDVGRLLGTHQPPQRGSAGRAERVLGPLGRHLRRGPAAQRLAARAGPAPRLGQFRRRVPAFSHERRPRGELLRACSSTTSPARTCANPRWPRGWRNARPTMAAR